MQRLAEICIRRPVFAVMLNLTLVIVGAVGFSRLGVDRVPSVDIPTVRIRATLPGASPSEMETEIADPIEEAVNTVEGIDELRSVSQSDRSFVIANFNLARDVDVAAQDVRDRIAGVQRNLPEDADPPEVSKVDNDSDPVMTVAVSGSRSLRELTEIADTVVRRRIERSPGVGEVRLVGGLRRTINVEVDADRLDALALSVTDVRAAIAAQNSEIPGGNITAPKRELSLRTEGRLRDARAFADAVIETRQGVPLRVSDVAKVEDGTAEQRTEARFNGRPTVVLEVVRQSGANTVAVIDGVKKALSVLENELPSGVSTAVIRDQSNYIRAALSEIEIHLVLGSILASIVVLLFMRSWRSTLIAAIAIPTSVIATFALMDALDFTLNSVTMLALVLMVGVVIDDAIVVLENIFRFIEEKGMSPMRAAKEATAEIGLAVLATTLSLVVIFVPVSFMSSVAGRFLYQFGITAAAAIMVSLFVSFTLTPMMASRLLKPARKSAHEAAPRSRGGFYALIDGVYLRLLQLAMRFRWMTTLVAVAVIASSIPALKALGREFVPTDVDEAEFGINVTAPQGVSVAAMSSVMQEVESVVRKTPGVRDLLITTGGFSGTTPNQADLYVRIAPHDERVFSFTRLMRETLAGRPRAAFEGNYSQSDLMSDLDDRLSRFKELRCQVRNFSAFNIGGGPFDVNFVLRGPELDRLLGYAENLRSRALAEGGFRGLDTTLRLDKPEVRVTIDRERAADLGVNAQDIGATLRLMVGGDDEVTRYRDPSTNELYEVRMRLRPADRSDSGIIGRLKVSDRTGNLVALESLASLVEVRTASRIDRLDRQRVVSLRGGVAPGYDLGGRIDRLRSMSVDLGMPSTYSTSVSGKSRELERTLTEFLFAFALSVVLMYLILASQFESLVHPLTILVSLPLSVPFAFLSLWLVGGSINVFSALGILVLFGVVKKNSILQVDHINQLRAKGMERSAAIIAGNRDRLRPILMTTLALVAGMLPLAVGTGPGAEERRAVAIVVIGGQSLCLLLTLLVTPVVYSLFDDLRGGVARREGPEETLDDREE